MMLNFAAADDDAADGERTTTRETEATPSSTGDWQEGLPKEILSEIFSHLLTNKKRSSQGTPGENKDALADARDVANAARACKTWRAAFPRHALSIFIPAVLENIDPDDFWKRWPLMKRLTAMGREAAPHAKTLVKLLGDRKKALRDEAARGLIRLGDLAQPHLVDVVELMERADNDGAYSQHRLGVKEATVVTLRGLRSVAKPRDVAAVVDLLKLHKNPETKDVAVEAICAMGRDVHSPYV